MRLPLWLIAVLFVGYSVWAVRFWCCKMCDCCGGETETELVADAQTTGVPLFKWNADEPESDPNFAEWKKNFLAAAGQGDTLVITGWYRDGEPGGEALALARAESIAGLLGPEMPESRLSILSKQIEDDGLEEGGAAMESAGFNWIALDLAKKEEENEVAIVESDKDVIFLFPFNSTERIRDGGVDEYMEKLVQKHKDNESEFVIVGHTDNIGSDASNMKLGLARAKAIESALLDNGISKDRIKTSSKGESEPVKDNSTEEGQRQNRRVVLTINSKN